MCKVLNVCFLSGGSLLLRIIRHWALGFGLKERGEKVKMLFSERV